MTRSFKITLASFDHDILLSWIKSGIFGVSPEEVNLRGVPVKATFVWSRSNDTDLTDRCESVSLRTQGHDGTCNQTLGLLPSNLLCGTIGGKFNSKGDASFCAKKAPESNLNQD